MLLIGKRGFTLLEVLIAVVLMGILVGITLPSFSGLLNSITTRTTGRQLVNNLEKIRSQAIIKEEEQQVLVKKKQLVYKSKSEDDAKSGAGLKFGAELKKLKWEPKEKDAKEDKAKPKKAENKQKESEKIKFFPDGRSSGGKLTVVTKDGTELTIIIEQVTGEIKLEE